MILSDTIAGAAFLLAILSPVLSAIITGIFHLREKRLDYKREAEARNEVFYKQHRAEAIERFISSAGGMIENPTYSTAELFGKAKGEAYLYIPCNLWAEVDTLCEHIHHKRYEEARLTLSALCKELASESVREKN